MKTWLRYALLAGLSVLASTHTQAQQPAGITMKNIEPEAFLGTPVRLYPDNSAMQANDKEQWGHLKLTLPGGFTSEQYFIRNVTNPSLYAFLPEPDKATGTAVIVAPGGAFLSLAVQTEGMDVAKVLNEKGIAAFVLTYTLNATPTDIPGYQKVVGDVFGAKARGEEPDIFVPQAPNDALAALRYVKQHANAYGVDPQKVGFIGFSAGAMTTLSASVAEASERPAFLGYIYGPMNAIDVPANAPPMFAALALDDGLFGKMGFGIVGAWQAKGIPVELHAYEKGEHGFGVGRPGTTSAGMMDQFIAWLATHKL
ncbi:alpha/beta hydrolase [Aestuariibacter sp. GS-14]|uniref:alpha/beta hydrolase n=1 Tax=Aestuariibacter sp. GS-14 TaxID=2590670 RepID=UPI001125BD32|nr:alpha/beta hydrolase [Aestuariibacter sp. GS-14]TPV60792.1 alpha/beta hydrolase [Aestuariibacter sp. GS-14]